jgi:hypothetical protein
MSPAKTAAASVIAAVSLSACGVAAKPEAGSRQAVAASYKNITDPRKKHVTCLRQKHIHFHELMIDGKPSIQVGTRPSGPTIVFYITPGAAQNEQLTGHAQGAEVIGAALLYPNQTPNKLLGKVESCTAKGVTG